MCCGNSGGEYLFRRQHLFPQLILSCFRNSRTQLTTPSSDYKYFSMAAMNHIVNTHGDCPASRRQIRDTVEVSNLVFTEINPGQNPMKWLSSTDRQNPSW